MGRFLWILSVSFTTALAIGLGSQTASAEETVAAAIYFDPDTSRSNQPFWGDMIESDSLPQADPAISFASFESRPAGSDQFLDMKSLTSLESETTSNGLPMKIGFTMQHPGQWAKVSGSAGSASVGDIWSPGIAGQIPLERWMGSPYLFRFAANFGEDEETHPGLSTTAFRDQKIEYERAYMNVSVGKVIDADTLRSQLDGDAGYIDFGMSYTLHRDNFRDPIVVQSIETIYDLTNPVVTVGDPSTGFTTTGTRGFRRTQSENHVLAPYLRAKQHMDYGKLRLEASVGAFAGLNMIERTGLYASEDYDPEAAFAYGGEIVTDASYPLSDRWDLNLRGSYQRIENVSTAFEERIAPGTLRHIDLFSFSLAATNHF